MLLQQEKPKQSAPVAKTPTVIEDRREVLPERSSRDIPERSNDRTSVRPNGKRIITRNSFEIYEDQMDSLREHAFQEKRQGKLGSMSAMVREAIDQYLRAKKS